MSKAGHRLTPDLFICPGSLRPESAFVAEQHKSI